ncbi:hypothetical protein TPA0909_45020 [Streptomyces albus]|nr:hypothetical protein TPA0909_45020 [Streptomyces albus]
MRQQPVGARLPALERVLGPALERVLGPGLERVPGPGLERVPGLEPVVPVVRAGPLLKGSVRRRRSVSGWGSSPLPVPYWPTR